MFSQITLVATAPLTNLALAVKLDPSFPSKLKGVFIMGGNTECEFFLSYTHLNLTLAGDLMVCPILCAFSSRKHHRVCRVQLRSRSRSCVHCAERVPLSHDHRLLGVHLPQQTELGNASLPRRIHAHTHTPRGCTTKLD